jgi:hypothetical protein
MLLISFFVNPVNTAYSRATSKETPKTEFFGINADVKYLANWIGGFVTRTNRWASPKSYWRKLWYHSCFWIGIRVTKQPMDVS